MKLSVVAVVVMVLVGIGVVGTRYWLVPAEGAEAVQLTPDQQRDVLQVAQDNDEFALDLYKQVASAEDGKNVFLSPFSISTALAMTYAGAVGQTKEEMKQTLRFTLPDERLHAAFSALTKGLVTTGEDAPYQLRVANRLWAQKKFHFERDFLGLVDKYYKGGVEQVDFVAAAETVKRINSWVEDQTNGKIKDLLKPTDVNPLTRLILTNAIYFKGKWEAPFKKEDTQDAPFYTDDGGKVQVPMMHQKAEFEYAEVPAGDGQMQVLVMPYAGGDLAMAILLPPKGRIGQLEDALTVERLGKLDLRKQKVDVYVPRFKLEDKYYLGKVLIGMGMPHAFSDAADFSKMTGKPDLKIAKVIHGTFVDVNEEGTEAAAATHVEMELKMAPMPRPVPVFRADHPFVFMIVHVPTQSILFIGRLTKAETAREAEGQ
ncbi:MAG: serpin family protein [Armatimonadetes bacterium]|nr:serpin family protein [Armatimonadota bacterium]